MDRRPGRLRVCVLVFLTFAWGAGSWPGAAELQGDELQVRIIEPGPDRAAVGPTMFTVVVKVPPGRRVVSVAFWVDGHLVAERDQPPWQTMFDAGPTLHPHTLRAEVTDDRGAQAIDLSTTLYISYVEQVEVIGAHTDRYALQVGVLDHRRRPILDLPAERFSLRLRGKKEQLLSAQRDERPLAVEILLDVSGTTAVYWPQIREAANQFISLLDQEDGSEIMIFAGDVGRLVKFTHDHLDARSKVLAMRDSYHYPGFDPHGTHLYDALAAGIEEINVRPGQRSLVVLTDSMDYGSLISYKQIAKVVRRAGLRLDVVRFGQNIDSYSSEDTRMVKHLRKLAKASGGMEWAVFDADEVPGIFRRLAEQLKSRYRLVFAPELSPAEQARLLSVKVKVNVPNRKVKVLAPAVLFSAPGQTTEAPSPH
jgi:VWFA-related protein